jgi:glutathione S-transferase
VLLYDNDISGNCYKVRLLLTQLKIPFERRQLSVFDRSDRSEVLHQLNPALRVPTLVLADGRPLAESNAILCYFARGTSLLPDEPYEQAQTMQWLFFEQYSHEPNIAVARFWAHAKIEPSDADRERTTTGGHAALAAMEHHLDSREFFVAERYTIADIALYAYTHVAPEGGFALDPYPSVRAWLERVASQPGHIAITA